MTHSFSLFVRGLAAAALLLSALAGCNTVVECSTGEVRYAGRPPRALFAYERSCREDCFAMPEAGGCAESCDDIDIAAPSGMLLNDRQLVIADLDTLGDGRGLFYSFTFVDEADGDAPVGWGFMAAGPRTYLGDQIDGTARFVMETTVAEYTVDPSGMITFDTLSSEPQRAIPARLEVRSTSTDNIAGRFFLGWENSTGQAQGEVVGCFDLNVGAPTDVAGIAVRPLGS